MSEFFLLFRIAVRNLFSSFLNFVIGGIIFVGTLLFVIGGSVLNSIDSSMSRSIIGSIAGHIQVYSDKSKDELSLYGDWGYPDISAMPDFSKIQGPLLEIPNVQTIIPMGVEGAIVTHGNTMDVILERLRAAINKKRNGDKSPELSDRVQSITQHVRQMIGVIQNDIKKLKVMASAQAIETDSLQAITKASSPEFWNTFDKDPLGHLEFLENRIASLIPDADFIFLAYVGTDLEAFKKSFDRMQVVDGEMVPTGRRGLMLSKYAYETMFKLKVAHRLDKIKEAVDEKGKLIAKDPDLQLMVKQNRTQTRELLLQLDAMAAAKATASVQKFLKTEEKVLPKLLATLLDTDDSNFKDRYQFFYKEIAPLIEIYRLRPGETLTIKAFTKSGFVQSTNIKVYGTFHFKGLEKSGLAGGMSLMDIMSFRDLYGYQTPEKQAESRALKKAAGAVYVDRDQAESALFGGSSIVGTAEKSKINDAEELGGLKVAAIGEKIMNRVYSKSEIETGVALNAAIILKDPRKMDETMKEIEKVSKDNKLDLRVVSWQKAAGNLGQFVFMAKLVLYFAVFVIFIVALVIINNAVMMATLQRIKEIGTMRAIGAQRTFVLMLVLVETLMLGAVFGLAGTFAGSLVVKWLGATGIPAANEFLYFFFSGPRLHVGLELGTVVGSLLIIVIVTSISALYPALIATRVSPLQAMQTED